MARLAHLRLEIVPEAVLAQASVVLQRLPVSANDVARLAFLRVIATQAGLLAR